MYTLHIKHGGFRTNFSYPVVDDYNNIKYKVDRKYQWLNFLAELRDSKDEPVFSMEFENFKWMPICIVSFYDGRSYKIKQNYNLKNWDLELQADDYLLKLTGSYWKIDFEVKKEDLLIAKITGKYLSLQFNYDIQIYDDSYEEDVLALVLTLDEIRARS